MSKPPTYLELLKAFHNGWRGLGAVGQKRKELIEAARMGQKNRERNQPRGAEVRT